MDNRLYQRKYLLECLGKLGEVSKQQQVREHQPNYHFIHEVFLGFFLFLSYRVLLSLVGYAKKHFWTFWTLQALASLNCEKHIKNAKKLRSTESISGGIFKIQFSPKPSKI